MAVSYTHLGITLDQICEQLSIPKTSAYDILTTLVHTGMVHVAREQKLSLIHI